ATRRRPPQFPNATGARYYWARFRVAHEHFLQSGVVVIATPCAPRAHTVPQRPRRHYHASRPPPTIVRSHPHRSPLCACGTAAGNRSQLTPRAERSQGPHAHTGCAKRRRLQDNRVSHRLHTTEPTKASSQLFAALNLPEVTSNGKVEGPRYGARSAPRAHTVFPRPRRRATHASRPPPTIARSHPYVFWPEYHSRRLSSEPR